MRGCAEPPVGHRADCHPPFVVYHPTMNARERREADEELARLGLKVDLKSHRYQWVTIDGEETRVPVSEGIAAGAVSAIAKIKGEAAARDMWRIYEPLIRAGRVSATGYAGDIAHSDMWRHDAAVAAADAGVSGAAYRRFFEAFFKAASRHATKLLKDQHIKESKRSRAAVDRIMRRAGSAGT